MNSLPLLIIGAPAVLAVIAAKKAQKQQQPKAEPPYRDWQWPKRWRPNAKTGNR